jgi:hypothetical protein
MGRGTYETQRMDVEVEVMDHENPDEVFAAVKAQVESKLGIVQMSEEDYRAQKQRIEQYERRQGLTNNTDRY